MRVNKFAGLAVAFSVCLFLSYFSIRNALAYHYSTQGTLEGYTKAAALEPGDARNWVLLGNFWQYDIQHADPQRAIEAYRSALSLDPKSADAWLQLASAYEGQDEPVEARQCLVNAKRAYPVSAEVSWRYANFLARQGELDDALREARQAVQDEPGRAWEAFAIFQRFYPDTQTLLDRLLPQTQTAYLDVIWGLLSQGRIDDALASWNRLMAFNHQTASLPPTGTYQTTRVILVSLVDESVSKGYFSDAARVWDQALTFMNISRPQDPPGSLVWDGGFETDLTGGLSWRINPSQGTLASFDKHIKHSGTRALKLRFDGNHNPDFRGVCQLVVVNPETTYEFSAWMKAEDITTDQGVFFGLSAKQREMEVTTEPFTGTRPWTQVKTRWVSTKDVHLLNVCLGRNKSYHVYNTIAGTAWVDDVQLIPVLP